MKYTPRLPKENVNVSKVKPLKEFFFLLGSVFAIILSIYYVLGFSVDLVVPYISDDMEIALGEMFAGRYTDSQTSDAEKRLQAIVDGLLEHAPEDVKNRSYPYRVHVKVDSQVNAMALPGGNIIVLSGLLEHAESENEVTMVLGHELGHYANRDHLRGLGRGLVFAFLSSTFFGADSSITELVGTSLVAAQASFSQTQEHNADLFGMRLLNSHYGHVGGLTDFFTKLKKLEHQSYVSSFLASHPVTDERIGLLNDEAKKLGFTFEEKSPYSFE